MILVADKRPDSTGPTDHDAVVENRHVNAGPRRINIETLVSFPGDGAITTRWTIAGGGNRPVGKRSLKW
jgi:hypothetical protein